MSLVQQNRINKGCHSRPKKMDNRKVYPLSDASCTVQQMYRVFHQPWIYMGTTDWKLNASSKNIRTNVFHLVDLCPKISNHSLFSDFLSEFVLGCLPFPFLDSSPQHSSRSVTAFFTLILILIVTSLETVNVKVIWDISRSF